MAKVQFKRASGAFSAFAEKVFHGFLPQIFFGD
jgi:hypothetical protein